MANREGCLDTLSGGGGARWWNPCKNRWWTIKEKATAFHLPVYTRFAETSGVPPIDCNILSHTQLDKTSHVGILTVAFAAVLGSISIKEVIPEDPKGGQGIKKGCGKGKSKAHSAAPKGKSPEDDIDDSALPSTIRFHTTKRAYIVKIRELEVVEEFKVKDWHARDAAKANVGRRNLH